MPTHYGTHLDFPFHFSENGKTASDYKADNFVFNEVEIIEIESGDVKDYLIKNENLNVKGLNSSTDLLIIKTGFCHKRHLDEYWEKGLGFHSETAAYIKAHFSHLKAIAFDLISLNSYQQREMGRKAHKEFLIKQDVLIVEEVDLRNVNSKTKFKQVIIAPLLMEKSDGAPTTIMAEVYE